MTHPLRRRTDGSFDRVSWVDALDDIGSRLRRILYVHDPSAVGWYLGNPSAFSYSHPIWVKGFMGSTRPPGVDNRTLGTAVPSSVGLRPS